jgi:hypothetical protein
MRFGDLRDRFGAVHKALAASSLRARFDPSPLECPRRFVTPSGASSTLPNQATDHARPIDMGSLRSIKYRLAMIVTLVCTR